jgi:signal transduction histidine kinase
MMMGASHLASMHELPAAAVRTAARMLRSSHRMRRIIDDLLDFSVHNGGAVIPPGELGQLFEPFRKGAASSRGLGLGLFIAREIVRAHRSAIEAASGPDGTTFTVRLPRA